jgi:hypothetical protein
MGPQGARPLSSAKLSLPATTVGCRVIGKPNVKHVWPGSPLYRVRRNNSNRQPSSQPSRRPLILVPRYRRPRRLREMAPGSRGGGSTVPGMDIL